MKKHLKTTALVAALVCGSAMLTFVPAALALDTTPTQMCRSTTNQTYVIPAYSVPRRTGAPYNDTIGPCSST
jgi:hypothetical protein